MLSDEEIRRIADELLAGLRAAKPRTQQELAARLEAFQAVFHAVQKDRGTPSALASCAPAIDGLEEVAREGGYRLPEWFLEIVSIVHLQATRDRIRAATEGLSKALDDVTRGTKES